MNRGAEIGIVTADTAMVALNRHTEFGRALFTIAGAQPKSMYASLVLTRWATPDDVRWAERDLIDQLYRDALHANASIIARGQVTWESDTKNTRRYVVRALAVPMPVQKVSASW